MDQGITHYEYDEQGYLTKAVDQAKVTYLENQYDNRGRVVLQTLANGDTYKAEYLDEERQVRVHSSIGKKTVLYCYGKECQILSMRFTDGTETAYEYDEAGYPDKETKTALYDEMLANGCEGAVNSAELFKKSDYILISMPTSKQVEMNVMGEEGILENARPRLQRRTGYGGL